MLDDSKRKKIRKLAQILVTPILPGDFDRACHAIKHLIEVAEHEQAMERIKSAGATRKR